MKMINDFVIFVRGFISISLFHFSSECSLTSFPPDLDTISFLGTGW